MTVPSNLAPAASGQPDGHLGELAAGAAIALLLAHADEALALEHLAADVAAGPVRVAAVELLQWATKRWVSAFGSLDARIDAAQWADLRPHVIRQLRAARPADPSPAVIEHAEQALTMGTRQAATALDIPTPEPRTLDPDTVKLAHSTGTAITDRYATAEKLIDATTVETHPQLVQALAPTHAAANDVDRDARTAVNTAVNQGSQDVAAATGADLLWFSEKSACVVCAALAGTVVKAGASFPASATFGDKPTKWWTPPGYVGPLLPPRHPRCRCRVECWFGHAGPPGSLTLPEALRREAERGVLRGFSVPSEGEQVRVRAADRLLKRGTRLPKSVQAYARAAVRRGRFTTRNVP
jgi:hypothetical protein